MDSNAFAVISGITLGFILIPMLNVQKYNEKIIDTRIEEKEFKLADWLYIIPSISMLIGGMWFWTYFSLNHFIGIIMGIAFTALSAAGFHSHKNTVAIVNNEQCIFMTKKLWIDKVLKVSTRDIISTGIYSGSLVIQCANNKKIVVTAQWKNLGLLLSMLKSKEA